MSTHLFCVATLATRLTPELHENIEQARQIGVPYVLVADPRHLSSLDSAAVAHTIEHEWTGSYGKARSAGAAGISKIDLAEWVIWVDADELVVEFDLAEVEAILQDARASDALTLTVQDPLRAESIPRAHHCTTHWSGDVHEYIECVRMGGHLPVTLEHSGYLDEELTLRKFQYYFSKTQNQALADPNNPRWIYFCVRDGQFFVEWQKIIQWVRRLFDIYGTSQPIGGLDGRDYLEAAVSVAKKSALKRGGRADIEALVLCLVENQEYINALHLDLLALKDRGEALEEHRYRAAANMVSSQQDDPVANECRELLELQKNQIRHLDT